MTKVLYLYFQMLKFNKFNFLLTTFWYFPYLSGKRKKGIIDTNTQQRLCKQFLKPNWDFDS